MRIRLEWELRKGLVLRFLTHLKNGSFDDAIAQFAEEFRFKDHGLGLEFKGRERLREFFQKQGNSIQTLSCRLTRFSSVVIT